MKVLITGGAGFIGSYLTERLIEGGDEVVILDSFHHQIHGMQPNKDVPWLRKATVYHAGVEDAAALEAAAKDVDAVVHLAAETGTGQSMQEIARYGTANLTGTTNLAHLVANGNLPRLKKIVVASSRAIYGEGKYECAAHGAVYPEPRTAARMDAQVFEPVCPICGTDVQAVANDEATKKSPASFYGLTKQFQEECLLLVGQAFGVPAVALRFQNVYGPRQSLKNPYTGVLTVFARQAFHGREINVFEDGCESRDFVYVEDVVSALAAALVCEAPSRVYNVGTGAATPMLEVATRINEYFGSKSAVNISGQYRVGDIRHNYADISKARSELGYCPQMDVGTGLARFCQWAENELKTETQG